MDRKRGTGMKKKITITDIAELCHVSKSSVSRYLNHGYVSKENAEKIKKAIEETGFETNFFASRLKAKHSRLIGILVGDIATYETARTLNGMQKKLSALGYQGVILLGEHQEEKEIDCIRSFAQQGVDGIIITDCDHVVQLEGAVEKAKIPVLYANRVCKYAPFLDIDEKQAGELIGQALCSTQQEKIAYLQYDENKGAKRKSGVLAAYENKGLSCTWDVLTIDGTLANAYEQAHAIIENRYDCVLCENDEFALAIMKYFHEFHIHVPQNIRIASFGGNEISAMSAPAITTVAYDYETFGENLVEEMIAILEGRAPVFAMVAITLLERESIKHR